MLKRISESDCITHSAQCDVSIDKKIDKCVDAWATENIFFVYHSGLGLDVCEFDTETCY